MDYYKKKYDEALERARKLKENPQSVFNEYSPKEGDTICDYIFPELKESEDEKIRKELIEHVKDQQSSFISAPDCRDKYEEEENDKYNSWLAWLEKQGEQNPPKWKYKKDSTSLLKDSIVLNKYGCVAKLPSGAIVSDVWVLDYNELAKLPKEELEVEQKQNWDEEDKRMFDYALDMIEWYSGKDEKRVRLVSDWLKSLRQRIEE